MTTLECQLDTLQVNDDEEYDEAVLMRLRKDGDDYAFETIEDDDEFEEVAKILADEGYCDDPDCECHHNH